MTEKKAKKRKLNIIPRVENDRSYEAGICNIIDVYGWTDDNKKVYIGKIIPRHFNKNSTLGSLGALNFTSVEDKNINHILKQMLQFIDCFGEGDYFGYYFVLNKSKNEYDKNKLREQIAENYKEEIETYITELNKKINYNFLIMFEDFIRVQALYLKTFITQYKENKTIEEMDSTSYNQTNSKDMFDDEITRKYTLQQVEHIVNSMAIQLQDVLGNASNYDTKVKDISLYESYKRDIKSVDNIANDYQRKTKI